jgi:NADH-quinone oxidoreductase subunit M
VAAAAVILAALYILLTYQKIFTGPVRDELAQTADLSHRERWVVGPLLALMLVLGFYPAPALDLVREPAAVTLEHVGVQDVPATVGAHATESEGSDQ